MKIVELPSFAPGSLGVSQPELRNGLMAPRINGATEIQQGTIFAEQLVVGNQTWVHDLVWTATDHNTLTWSEGTLRFAGGDSYAIVTGNTADAAATTYIYFDVEVSQTELQQTTEYDEAVGDRKILLAIASPVASGEGNIKVTPFGAEGTTISGDQITTGKIQSVDGNTYWDLVLKKFVVSDGTNDRILLGYQAGGF